MGGCLICSRMNDRLYRYSYTVAALFEEDPEFKEELKRSKGFCMHHTRVLYETASDAIKGDVLLEYYKTLADLLRKNLERVQADDYYLTQKYKSENKDKPWNGCEDAAKRAVQPGVGHKRTITAVGQHEAFRPPGIIFCAFIQHRIAQVLRTKNTPRLTFLRDDSYKEAERINRLIDEALGNSDDKS